jgi:hypothetical protein
MVTGTKPHLHIVRSSMPVYQLRIALADSEPLIWRQLLVSGAVTLATLNVIFQHAMGWRGSHRHEFVIGDTRYGQPDPDHPETVPVIDEQTVTLSGLVKVGEHFSYLYDFGDDWQHDITVEALLPADVTSVTPLCIAGANACPPEDVGGIPGYVDFLDILGDPSHDEHQETLEWCGGGFDPAVFDQAETNRRLAGLKL